MGSRARIFTAAAIVLLVGASLAFAQGRGGRGFGGFGGPGMGETELQIVAQFDKNGDGRLDATERQAARASLDGQRPAGRGRGFAAAPPAPGKAIAPADIRPPYPTTPLYDMATLRTIFITFPNADWERELTTFYNTDVEVPATVVVDGRTYTDVGIHFRGNSSYRQVPDGYKRSLNLSFDYVKENQDLRGYTTLNLLNSHTDPTFLRTVLSQEIARAYLPALKSNYVRVVINGESWGVYVNNQQFNKGFVKEWFPNNDGARWKVPGSPRGRAGLEYWGENALAEYRRTFEIKSKDEPKAWTDLINLTKVLNETPPEQLPAAIEPILDVDQVLRFLAVDVALANGDGYWARASDYVIYQEPSGRFHVFPGDMNETFADGGGGGRGGFGGGGATLDPLVGLNDTSKPLRARLLAVPAYRAKYLGYVRDIATTWLDWSRLGPLAERYQALIVADVTADTRKLDSIDQFPADTASDRDLKGFVERRRAFLLKE